MIILIAILMESWKFEKSREKLKLSFLYICVSFRLLVGSYYYMLILSEDLF